MRRLIPLALAALVALCGCGTERPTATPEADPSLGSAPTPTATPTRTPEPSLAEFPLALGYEDENGDDHSPVEVTGRPATTAFELCGLPTWDPLAGTTDVLGVEFRGEAEWARGRTLVLYATEDDAEVAVTAVADALAGCPDEPDGQGYGTSHTPSDIRTGDQSVVWADTYWFTSDGEKLHDTGLTVYDLVRVGRAVMLSYEYGEGNGSEQTRRSAIARATEADQPVVDAMGDL
jgi:hypothetical protein